MEVDAKEIFANERTYVEWLQMSMTLGGVAIGLLGFSVRGVSKSFGKVTQTQSETNIQSVSAEEADNTVLFSRVKIYSISNL